MLLNKRISVFAFIKQIKLDILAIVAYVAAIGSAHQLGYIYHPNLPLALTAIIGTALSLLLAFRTAQAYERWWEARTVWGAIVNDSRTLIRQLLQFTTQEESSKIIINIIANQHIIWCYALGESLRKLPFSGRVKTFLDENDVVAQNVPNQLLLRQGLLIRDLGMTEFRQIQLDSTLSRLCDAMGKCERIKNTVFPKSYSLLVHLLIYIFATLLPFGLDERYFLSQIFLTALVPLIFIAIEHTAITLQDPFENKPTDTPLTSIAVTIEINVKQMLGNPDLPPAHPPTGYYLM